MDVSNLANLFNALFSCFIIIIFGYSAGRLNIITHTQSQGIGNFVGSFALPALLFKSMVELNFHTVNWALMLAILSAKTVVFLIVILLTILVLRKNDMGRAALYAIFATQSNDIALGYPIIEVLYSKTNPELLQYIYLLAPISVLILNPIGFVMLEIDKNWRMQKQSNEESAVLGDTSADPCSSCPLNGACDEEPSTSVKQNRNKSVKTYLNIVKGLLLNPIVVMVFVGIIFHFILNGKVPGLANQFLTMLSNAFSAAALFYLGLTLVGKLGNTGSVSLLVVSGLVAAKLLLLPILAREATLLFAKVVPVTPPFSPHHNGTETSVFGNSSSPPNMTYVDKLANFGYLYGTFPTAPTVVIYASKFGREIDRLATGMVLCTVLSAPIMYVSAWTLTITSMDVDYYKEKVVLADQDVSIVGSLCALWCILIFVFGKKFQKIPHVITLVMTCTMFLSALMTVVIEVVTRSASPSFAATQKTLFIFLYFGVTATRLLTATLAICLVIVKYRGERQAWNFKWLLIGIPVIMAMLLTLLVYFLSPEITDVTPVFQHGRFQVVMSFSVLLISLCVSVAALVALFRIPGLFNRNPRLATERDSMSDQESDSSESNQLLTPGEQDADVSVPPEASIEEVLETNNLKWWELHSGHPEITRHIVLLLLLTVSLFIGTVVTGWRVDQRAISGVYFEIGFLDSVFNFGQAFFVFAVFGLDSELIIDPFLRSVRKLIKGDEKISLTPLSEVDKDILRQCHVFVIHHLQHCKKDLVKERRRGFRTYKDVLTGCNLCTWLVEVGLAADRQDALLYGQHLMLGRVISHVDNTLHFYDKAFLYRFEDSKPKSCDRNSRSATVSSASSTSTSGTSSVCALRRCDFSFEKFLTEDDLGLASVSSPARRRSRKPTRRITETRPSDEEYSVSRLDQRVGGGEANDALLVEESTDGNLLTVHAPTHSKSSDIVARDLNDW